MRQPRHLSHGLKHLEPCGEHSLSQCVISAWPQRSAHRRRSARREPSPLWSLQVLGKNIRFTGWRRVMGRRSTAQIIQQRLRALARPSPAGRSARQGGQAGTAPRKRSSQESGRAGPTAAPLAQAVSGPHQRRCNPECDIPRERMARSVKRCHWTSQEGCNVSHSPQNAADSGAIADATADGRRRRSPARLPLPRTSRAAYTPRVRRTATTPCGSARRRSRSGQVTEPGSPSRSRPWPICTARRRPERQRPAGWRHGVILAVRSRHRRPVGPDLDRRTLKRGRRVRGHRHRDDAEQRSHRHLRATRPYDQRTLTGGRAGRSGLRMHCPGACAAARAQVVLPRAAAPTNRCACLASPSAPLTGPGSRPGPTATISA